MYCTISTTNPVFNQVELAWLTCYPLSSKVIVNRGNKFLAELREMIVNDYGIKIIPISSWNPQAKAILGRVHQTIGNVLRTFKKTKYGTGRQKIMKKKIQRRSFFMLEAIISEVSGQHVR